VRIGLRVSASGALGVACGDAEVWNSTVHVGDPEAFLQERPSRWSCRPSRRCVGPAYLHKQFAVRFHTMRFAGRRFTAVEAMPRRWPPSTTPMLVAIYRMLGDIPECRAGPSAISARLARVGQLERGANVTGRSAELARAIKLFSSLLLLRAASGHGLVSRAALEWLPAALFGCGQSEPETSSWREACTREAA
jgi:hypothetical protein